MKQIKEKDKMVHRAIMRQRGWKIQISKVRYRNTLRITGVGAGKFLGVRRIFARISPKLGQKGFVPTFLPQRDNEDHFLGWPPKKGLHVVLQTLDAMFWNQTTLGAIFAQTFRDFAKIFTD